MGSERAAAAVVDAAGSGDEEEEEGESRRPVGWAPPLVDAATANAHAATAQTWWVGGGDGVGRAGVRREGEGRDRRQPDG